MENNSVHLDKPAETSTDTSLMADRELIELAAKAYADPLITPSFPEFSRWIGRNEDMGCDVFVNWNPLHDDGDALRLAVKLGFTVSINKSRSKRPAYTAVWTYGVPQLQERHGADQLAATRRAIVRAAAAIAQSGINPKS